MASQFIDAISKVSLEGEGAPSIQPSGRVGGVSNPEEFKRLMSDLPRTEIGFVDQNTNPNPMTTASAEAAKGSPAAVQDSISTLNTKLDEAREQLKVISQQNPDYKFRAGEERLLQQRVNKIHENINVAREKANEPGLVDAPEETTGTSPVLRFLDLLGNSQDRLQSLGNTMANISSNGDISQAQMMSIQIKVNGAQQQLELFTNLLNKSLESCKTLLNVQI